MTSPLSVLLQQWNWTSPMWLIALAAAFFYVRGQRRSGGLTGRAWCFAAALAFFLLATVSPLHRLAYGYLFSAHMVQHLVLLLIVPGFLLLSFSGEQWQAALRHPAFARFTRVFGYPLVGWFLGSSAMWLWHVPRFCVASQTVSMVADFQTLSLLFMGACFWWPVAAPASVRMEALPSIGYLFTGCLACTLLGVYLTFSPISVCPSFLTAPDPLGVMPYLRETLGMSTSVDQQLGGLLMWVPACLIYAGAICVVFARWYNSRPQPSSAPAH
ncbi:MAG: cytochrome c oxidase assembly protein [Verrucomicrobium sp.]|nr:cytochrome c oxidase assembly protein [Verrucomicrobium sp.]